MKPVSLGRTGLQVSPVGFGAFKIGRNEKTKYADAYALPDEAEAARLLHGVLDLGVTHIDTAPAYGLSEQRIGRHLADRRREFVLSTKVGETFAGGESHYDFTAAGIRSSLERSLRALRTDAVDLVLIHAPADDLRVLHETPAVEELLEARARGWTRAVGLSAKSVEAAESALGWADVLMLEYHLDDRRQAPVIARAAERGIGVIVKKGLASGRLPPREAIRFVLGTPGVGNLVIGSLNLAHVQQCLAAAEECRAGG